MKTLDLSANNLTYFPIGIFSQFEQLRELVLDDNGVGLNKIEIEDLSRSLHRLSLLHVEPLTPFTDLDALSNLRALNVSAIFINTISPKLFDGFGTGLQHLKISHAKVNSVMNGALSHLRGLKWLDLSENRIGRMEEESFQEVGHSLQTLLMSNAIRMSSISPGVLQKLTAVQQLDLSSNTLRSLGDGSFAHCAQLTHLNLRFNKLDKISPSVFDPAKTPLLKELALSFNQLKELREATFSKLRDLEQLELNENAITGISRRAFIDLTLVKVINLAGKTTYEFLFEFLGLIFNIFRKPNCPTGR